jgi:hypothetical protein
MRGYELMVPGAVAAITLGVALAFAGIRVGPLFVPGTLLILIGLIAAAAAGVLAVIRDAAGAT